MNVKEAVSLAKTYLIDLYADEQITNLGLEEVDFDEIRSVWFVTIGFSRPWDEPKNTLAVLTGQNSISKRAFKTVRISDKESKVLSIKNRDAAP